MDRYRRDLSKGTLKDVINEQRTLIFALVVTILGLILIFIPGLPSQFETLGVALIPSGVITAITEFYLRKDFLREFRETRYRYDFIDKLERLGISDIVESRREEDPIFGYIISMARSAPHTIRKIQIMGLTLEPFMHVVGDHMDDLRRTGCEFQLLSLDVNSDVAKKRMSDQGQSGLLDRIRSFDTWIQQQIGKNNLKGNIVAKKYSFMPTMHITIINEERIFINPYPILGATWEFPVIEICKGGTLFDKYKNQFEEVWNRACPLT